MNCFMCKKTSQLKIRVKFDKDQSREYAYNTITKAAQSRKQLKRGSSRCRQDARKQYKQF